jgi:hypothetical protein
LSRSAHRRSSATSASNRFACAKGHDGHRWA